MPKTDVVISADLNGNAYAILGAARKGMKRAGVDPEIIEKYTKEATSGDYEHLLQVTFEYVEIE